MTFPDLTNRNYKANEGSDLQSTPCKGTINPHLINEDWNITLKNYGAYHHTSSIPTKQLEILKTNQDAIFMPFCYHNYDYYINSLEDIKEITEFLKGTKVTIFLENLFMMRERYSCTVLDLCEQIDSPNIRACIDICHIYCQAKIWHEPMKEFIKKYLDKVYKGRIIILKTNPQ